MIKSKKEAVRILREMAMEGDRCAAKFADKFNENPGQALEWSVGTFDKVAFGVVAKRAIKALTDKDSKATLESLLEWSSEEAMRFAGSPTRSTSPTSNLWHQCVAAGWARVAEIIRRGF